MEATDSQTEKREYYEDGTLKRVRRFKDGKLDGLQETFYPNGKLYLSSNYRAGRPEGENYVYYENGQPRTVAYFKGGKLHGLQKAFHPNGKIACISNYVKGNLHGIQQHFDTSDINTKTELYNNGTLEKTIYNT